MHVVPVVEITITEDGLNDYAWIFQYPVTEMTRHERLNTVNLNWLSRDRIAEAVTVAENLELGLKFEWQFWREPYWEGYRLRCNANFINPRDAVAFRLAWEPETATVSAF